MHDASDAASDIVSRCLATRTRMLERVISGLYASAASDHGVTVAQTTLLAAITKHPGVRASDLSRALHLEQSTLSRNLARLRKTGLIEGARGDGRDVHYTVTPTGEATLLALHHDWSEAQRQAESLLGESSEALHTLVHRLTGFGQP